MALPKLNDWPEHVRHAGTVGGFNILRDLEPALQHAIPDLKAFNLGVFVEEDLKNVMPIGWVHLTLSHLGYEIIDDFNREIGLRYGIIVDANSWLKIGDNFIMIMPKNYREKVQAERKRALDRQNALSQQRAAYVHPSDPNYSEMMAGAQELADETSSKYKLQVSGQPESAEASVPKKRGRPPKNK